MDTLTLLLAAVVLGGLAGGLIDAVATRLPAGLAVVGPPVRGDSHTPYARALAPFVGAWSSDGWNLPKLATDLAAAAALYAAFALQGWSFDGIRACIFALLLLLILRIDWQNHLIYMITIVPGVLVALALSAYASISQNDFSNLLSSSIAGVAAAFVFLLLFMFAVAVYKKRALGFGDVLLAGLIGTMTGRNVATALMLGMLLASIGGLFLIAIRVRKRTDYIPYGAYLSLGALIVVLLK
jgi:leader peptidase (prepilin peptidase) / N-methyltransferase